jgi:hypothetical protein
MGLSSDFQASGTRAWLKGLAGSFLNFRTRHPATQNEFSNKTRLLELVSETKGDVNNEAWPV